MTVLELIEMLRTAGERAAQHRSKKLTVQLMVGVGGIVVQVSHYKDEAHSIFMGGAVGDASWEDLPDLEPTRLSEFVDETVSRATDDRPKRQGKGKLPGKKGSVIQLSEWLRTKEKNE